MGKCAAISFCVAISFISACSNAKAEVLNLNGYGPTSRSMGGTGVSFDIGTYALMKNPATLDLIPTKGQIDSGIDIVVPQIVVRSLATGERAVSSKNSIVNASGYIPQLGIARHFGKYLTLGVGAFGQAGIGTSFGNHSFLSRGFGALPTYLENSDQLNILKIPIGASIRLPKKLHGLVIGGTIEPTVAGISLNQVLLPDQLGAMAQAGRANGTLLPVMGQIPSLRAAQLSVGSQTNFFPSAWSAGLTGKIGTLYDFGQGTKIGGVYQFRSGLSDFRGPATLTGVSGIVGNVTLPGRIRFVDMQLPPQFCIGVSHEHKRALLAAEFQTVFWRHTFKNVNFAYYDGGGRTLFANVPQGWGNSYLFNLGGQYKFKRRLTVRSGIFITNNVMPAKTLSALFPSYLRNGYACGASYRLTEKTTLNFAFEHVWKTQLENAQLPNVSPTTPINSTHAQNNFVFNFQRAI